MNDVGWRANYRIERSRVGSSARVVIEPFRSTLVFWPHCPETLRVITGVDLCGKAGGCRAEIKIDSEKKTKVGKLYTGKADGNGRRDTNAGSRVVE